MSFSTLPGRPSPRGRHRGLLWPGLAACAVFLCGAAAESYPPPERALGEGLVLERELRAGERHRYPVSLKQGEFLRVVVDQNGIDVVVELLDPAEKVVSSVDSLNGASGDEDFAALALTTGPYLLEVKALGNGVSPGSYRLRVEGPRQPRDRDRARVEAVEAMQAAFQAPSVERAGRALELWRALGERRREAEMLLFLGRQQADQGDLECAQDHLVQAAGIWGELGDAGLGDPEWQVDALLEAGRANASLTRWEAARDRYEEGLAHARTAGNQVQQTVLTILNNLGYAYERLADKQRALRSYEEALGLARALKRPDFEAVALNNLGDTYFSLGDWEKARSLGLQALDLSRKLKDPAKEARTLNNLGAVAKRQVRLEEALDLYSQSLDLARRSGDVEAQSAALNNLAFLYLRLNQLDKAAERCREAMALGGADREAAIDARYVLGDVYRKQGNLEAARGELEKALALSRSRGDRSREGYTLLALARVERETGHLAGALERAEAVLDIVESLRTRVQDQSLRALFLAANQEEYEFAIDTAMALHKADPAAGSLARALRISERARARSLLEILSESGTDIRQGADPALLAREHLLRAELGQREMRRFRLLASGDPERLAEAERQSEETLEKYRGVQEDLRASSPRYAALTQPRPLNLEEIRAQVLDGQAVLLEYSLGAERSYLWAVTPGSIQGFELPGRVHIEKAVSTYYERLTVRNQHLPGEGVAGYRRRISQVEPQVRAAAAELARIVLAPIEGLLGTGTVLVVADGALQYVPFNALPLPSTGDPMIARQEVVSLPSASALAMLRQETRGRGRAEKTLAVLADPVFREDDERLLRRITVPAPRRATAARLPPHRGLSLALARSREAEASSTKLPRLFFSEDEAKAIAALVPADQRLEALGFAASRERATSGELGAYRLVHFATHGLLRSDHPELSSLVLSLFDEQGRPVDGFLRLSDIYNLELKADLVVLSACQTALGQEIRGEGLVGLTRGFMYAGAERVLASLWSVEDRATAELMKRFYRALLVEKMRPAAALRQAQLDMAKDPRWSSPYYWAGFSLQGEWN
jgi:CHAT domain-containing protein/tetratricopeptide (TPR) repeat protein